MHMIPTNLAKVLPHGVAIEHCTITTLAELAAKHDVVVRVAGRSIPDSSTVVVLPGWYADDGNAEIHIPNADSGEDAARQYVESGDWGDERNRTVWIDVWAWRRALALNEDGRVIMIEIDRDRYTIEQEQINNDPALNPPT